MAEDAGQSSVTVRATAAAPMKAKTTVTLTVGASGDGATKTTDYTTSNVGKITIPKGASAGEAWFELTPVQDTLVEGDESHLGVGHQRRQPLGERHVPHADRRRRASRGHPLGGAGERGGERFGDPR